MDIVVLPRLEGRVIGRELQLGKPEGEFVMEDDGTIVYSSPYDKRRWFAAPSATLFLEAADCWARYCEQVAQAGSVGAGRAAVAELREKLRGLGLLDAPRVTVWSSFVEQAEHGFL
jgi:hypothetical protein